MEALEEPPICAMMPPVCSTVVSRPMMTRNAKITRLPKQVRHGLNGRLEDGEPGRQLPLLFNHLNQDLAPGTRTNRSQSPPQSPAPVQPN